MMSTYLRAGLCVAALSLVSLCGCPQSPPPKVDVQPFKGQAVEIVAPAALQLPAVWEVALQEWMNQTGATIQWNEYALSHGDDQSSLPTILSMPAPAGGRFVLFPLSHLSDIDAHLASIRTGSLDTKDLFKGLRDRVVSRNRAVVAVPVSAPVLLCYYRADLLRKAGLKPPETWDEYQSLVDSLDQWAKGLTAVEPLAADHRSTLFFARSLAFTKHPENFSVWFNLETAAPTLQTEGFREAMDSAHRAWQKMPAGIADLSPLDCRNQVLEGKAALAIGMEPAVGATNLARAESIEVGICRLPGSRRVFNPNSNRWDQLPAVHAPALCAFDGMAIGVGTTAEGSDHAAAWHLLSTLAGDAFETNWASLPKTVCRESQTGSASGWNESGLTVEESGRAVDAMAQMLRDAQVVADLPLPARDRFRKAASETIGKLLKSEVDSKQALEDLQTQFAQIVSDVGTKTIRTEYRRGLGLPPLETGPK